MVRLDSGVPDSFAEAMLKWEMSSLGYVRHRSFRPLLMYN